MKKMLTLADCPRHKWGEQSDKYMRMPWGKHKGKWISELPTDYIKWCLLNYKTEFGLLEVMKEELLRREPQLKRK